MIYDTFENIDLYFPAGHPIHQAVSFARDFDPNQPDGRYPILDSHVFALAQSYNTTPDSQRVFEAHKQFIDVQVILSGAERADVALNQQLKPLQEFDADNDVITYAPSDSYASLIMRPGLFAVFFPHDIHRPGCDLSPSSPIRKICVKVNVATL